MFQAVGKPNLLDDRVGLISIFTAISPVPHCRITNHQWSQHIFQNVQFGEQMVELKDESKDTVSDNVPSGRRKIVDSKCCGWLSIGAFASQPNFTDSWLIEQASDEAECSCRFPTDRRSTETHRDERASRLRAEPGFDAALSCKPSRSPRQTNVVWKRRWSKVSGRLACLSPVRNFPERCSQVSREMKVVRVWLRAEELARILSGITRNAEPEPGEVETLGEPAARWQVRQ